MKKKAAALMSRFKGLRNIPTLIFILTFSAIFMTRIGEADTIEWVGYILGIAGLLLIFIASNMKPKNQAKYPRL